jgi:crotonobetainyl-CoA:carnitine CoA-transferase CaiB-like acyl-CoA transferase
MGAPQLADDARFKDAVERSRHHEEIDDIIGAWCAKHDLAELESVLHQAGVPATRIFTMADIFRDPHYAARGAIVHAPDEDFGSVAMAAPVPRLSATPGRVRHAGHHIGQDTRRVLAEVAGYSAAEIEKLERAGVVQGSHGEPAVSPAKAGAQ